MSIAQNEAVLAVLRQYFDGLYRADTGILRAVFHDELNYVNATRDAFVAKRLPAYLDDVDHRTAPDELGDRRNPEVLHMLRVGQGMAFVDASMSMMGRDYRDALTLIETEAGWKVIAKVFTHTRIGEELCRM